MKKRKLSFRLLALLMTIFLMVPSTVMAEETNPNPGTQVETPGNESQDQTPGNESQIETPENESQDQTPETVTPEEPKEPEKPEIVRKKPSFRGTLSYALEYTSGKQIVLDMVTSSDGVKSYSTSDKDVATVSSKGVVTLKDAGSCKITLTTSTTDNYEAGSVTITFKMWKRPKRLSYSSSYKKSKYYTKLFKLKLTGTTRDDLLSIAGSQVGYYEGPSSKYLAGTKAGHRNYTEFGRFYGYNGVAWCAIFVNWVAREAGLSYNVVPKYCAVAQYYSWYRARGRVTSWSKVRTKSKVPKKGDIIFYSNVRGGTTHHIGYVESVKYSGSNVKIVTVEGNTKDRVRRVSMTLKKSNTSGKINGHYITGFGSPAY